jgi:hypothetical protein
MRENGKKLFVKQLLESASLQVFEDIQVRKNFA